MEQLYSQLDDWSKQLAAIPKQEFTIPRVLQFTQEKAIQPGDARSLTCSMPRAITRGT